MQKPITIKKSTCLFCSIGCGLSFRVVGDNATAIDYDKGNSVNCGSLCPRGYYNFELLNHPKRLTDPLIGKRKVSWNEALAYLEHGLKEFEAEEIGILFACNLSNEDAFAAAKLAKKIGTKNLASVGDMADLSAYQGNKADVPGAKTATLEDIENSEKLLIIGDILTRTPVLSKRINKVKYGKRGNMIIVIDPNKTHTSWFATRHIQNRPGTEASILSEMIEKGSKELEGATGTIIYSPDQNQERADFIASYVKMLSAKYPNMKHITFYSYGNTLGVNSILDQEIPGHLTYLELKKKVEDGQIKALIMLGELQPELAKKVRFLAVTDYFAEYISDEALMLPFASQLEQTASYTLADKRTEKLAPVVSAIGAKSNIEIISEVLKENLSTASGNLRIKFTVSEPVSKHVIEEIKKIPTKESVPQMNITHFGNNQLAKRFFWYRVNN